LLHGRSMQFLFACQAATPAPPATTQRKRQVLSLLAVLVQRYKY
jgi:hypothetical protein